MGELCNLAKTDLKLQNAVTHAFFYFFGVCKKVNCLKSNWQLIFFSFIAISAEKIGGLVAPFTQSQKSPKKWAKIHENWIFFKTRPNTSPIFF